MLQTWKNAPNGQWFFSDAFKTCDATWYLLIYPNGDEKKYKENIGIYRCDQLNQYKTSCDIN